MSADFFFDLSLKLLEVGEHFTLLLDWEDPCVARVVVDEGDLRTTSSDRQCLSRSPYIRVYYVNEAFAYVALLWEWKLRLFAELTSSHTRSTHFDSKVKSPMTTPFDCIDQSHFVHLGFETFGIHGRFHLL